MRMKAANNGDIAILGAILVRVRGFDRTGAAMETKQMCYITDGADRIFLNRDALTDLQVVSADLPTIGESTRRNSQQPYLPPSLSTPHLSVPAPIENRPHFHRRPCHLGCLPRRTMSLNLKAGCWNDTNLVHLTFVNTNAYPS